MSTIYTNPRYIDYEYEFARYIGSKNRFRVLREPDGIIPTMVKEERSYIEPITHKILEFARRQWSIGPYILEGFVDISTSKIPVASVNRICDYRPNKYMYEGAEKERTFIVLHNILSTIFGREYAGTLAREESLSEALKVLSLFFRTDPIDWFKNHEKLLREHSHLTHRGIKELEYQKRMAQHEQTR